MPEGMMMPEQEPIRQQPYSGVDPVYRPRRKFGGPPKPPGPPQVPGGEGGREREGPESLQDFMRRMTRNIRGEPWESTELIKQFGGYKEAADDFADLFWSLLIWNDEVALLGRELDEAPTFSGLLRASPFIVGFPSESGHRRDLLVFVPELLDEVVVRKAGFNGEWENIQRCAYFMQQKGRVMDSPRGQRLRDMMGFLEKARGAKQLFDQFITQSAPALVIAQQPPWEPHASIPTPALPVAESLKAAYSSTAGVVATNDTGVEGVTVAYHALLVGKKPGFVGQKVKVNGKTGEVVSIDVISDSAFVRVDGGTGSIPVRSFKRVRKSPAPGAGQDAEFDGCANPMQSTVITGCSPTLLIAHPGIQRQVLTNPDSSASDSGSALVDDTGELVGFCWGTSGISKVPTTSIWIWADSVFAAHNLT